MDANKHHHNCMLCAIWTILPLDDQVPVTVWLHMHETHGVPEQAVNEQEVLWMLSVTYFEPGRAHAELHRVTVLTPQLPPTKATECNHNWSRQVHRQS